eukprot:gene18752-25282_t
MVIQNVTCRGGQTLVKERKKEELETKGRSCGTNARKGGLRVGIKGLSTPDGQRRLPKRENVYTIVPPVTAAAAATTTTTPKPPPTKKDKPAGGTGRPGPGRPKGSKTNPGKAAAAAAAAAAAGRSPKVGEHDPSLPDKEGGALGKRGSSKNLGKRKSTAEVASPSPESVDPTWSRVQQV